MRFSPQFDSSDLSIVSMYSLAIVRISLFEAMTWLLSYLSANVMAAMAIEIPPVIVAAKSIHRAHSAASGSFSDVTLINIVHKKMSRKI